METKNTLRVGSLEFKITAEKLYIETATGTETYALRSINGISVKDDLALFNEQVNRLKGYKTQGGILAGFGIFFLISCNVMGVEFFSIMGNIMGLGCLIVGLWIMMVKRSQPRLQSVVRITMNSGDKAFAFFKDDTSSSDVADFVATLENTLTAFHKD